MNILKYIVKYNTYFIFNRILIIISFSTLKEEFSKWFIENILIPEEKVVEETIELPNKNKKKRTYKAPGK